MNDGSAIKEVERIVQKSITVDGNDGYQYSTQQLHPVYFQPRPATMSIQNLSGLVEYIKTNVDGLDFSNHIIQVKDETQVNLFSMIDGKDRKRDHIIQVQLDSSLKQFPYGEFMDLESFQIKTRSLMVMNESLQELLSFVATVSVDSGVQIDDDGVSQKVNTKLGMSGARVGKALAPSIVELAPYRTFREISQPESKFLFRMRPVEGKIPTMAIFEADGGFWKIEAVNRIKNWLSEQLPGFAILG